MRILQTDRLLLRVAALDDAAFYLELVNTPDFIAHIGERKIGTLQAARDAIASGPMAMQAARGHSIYMVTLRADGTPIGMAGLIKRDVLEDVDLGYAFLPRYYGQGYAYEAAAALLPHARTRLGVERLVAITSPGNEASQALLRKLGMRFEKVIYTSRDDPGTRLYSVSLI